MVLFWITLCGFLFLLAGIWVNVRKKKDSNVREYYAFRCVLLMLGMASDLVAGLLNPYSLWDFIASLLGIDKTEPYGITIVRWILALVVFVICCWLLCRTYKHWDGAISHRQYWSDVRDDNESSLFRDFVAVLTNTFMEDASLKEHKKLSDSLDYGEQGNIRAIPWHMEFAHIYRIRSNQAQIDLERDWHADQHCFICSYATYKKMAAYCADTMPSDTQIKTFLKYVYQLNSSYFKIIVAIKEGLERSYTQRIDGMQLEFLFKEDLLDKLVDFTGYYRAIDDLYHKPLPQGSEMRIEDVYVDLNCCVGEEKVSQPLEPYVFDWLEKGSQEQLAILGDFGMGKTLFSTNLAYHMIKSGVQRIPILIPLRNKSPRNSKVNEIFSYFTAQYGVHPDALNILNANGRLLLIFDGFDEMDLVGNDDIRKLHFRSLATLITPKSKVLITGRPNYFFSQSEMYSALGVRMGTEELPHFQTLSLQMFTKEQIRRALRNAKPSVQMGIQQVMDSNTSTSFLDLIRRPSQLFLVSQIWEDRHLAEKAQNLTSASILNEFLLSNFERQAAKGTQTPYFYLSPIEREYFMIGVAMRMYKMGVTAIAREFFEETIIELVELFPEQLSDENPVYLDLRNGKSIKAFAQADNESLLAIINDVRTCGILVNDYANDGFCFAHKSFYDLLVAKYFQGQYLKQHDSVMIISQVLSSSSSYSARLGNDMVIRKLTAELISEKIILAHKAETPEVMCEKIFHQCRRVITRLPGKRTPRRVFQRYLKKRPIAKRSAGNVQAKYRYRLLSLCSCLILIILAVFLWKGVQITGSLAENAAAYYDSALPVIMNAGGSEAAVSTANISFAVHIMLLGIVLLLLYGLDIGRRGIQVDDLLLLTWYYACTENQIPLKIIYHQASPNDPSIFSDYIAGHDFAQLQEKMRGEKKTRIMR